MTIYEQSWGTPTDARCSSVSTRAGPRVITPFTRTPESVIATLDGIAEDKGRLSVESGDLRQTSSRSEIQGDLLSHNVLAQLRNWSRV
ncbi:hypothetical protein [Nocardioides gansuensis]|uniref:hypothetical protein n=1 Tax=Nocardioides gansuensis TaxID=2138300 RepID=UPI001057CD01|nr:hypothetical protein [Nocardioides gansuensis]